MAPPAWRCVTARDEQTQVRVARAEDGTTSIKLSSGAISMTVAVTAEQLAFLLRQSPDEAA